MENKLCLGTVQFGLKYGIKNELGRKPNSNESFTILKEAINCDVGYFDTASIYGNAEELLGDFGIAAHNVKVISKLKPGISGINREQITKSILMEIKKSLKKLKSKTLDAYMLHDAKDFYNDQILYGMQQARTQGLINNIGVSVYEVEDALNVVKCDTIDYIQIPYNVFDQRLDQTDFFTLAAKNNVKVFARSAFLQGLLLMDEKCIPPKIVEAIPWLRKFNSLIDGYGFSRSEAAFLFSYCHKGIDKVVFGVDNNKQLDYNFKIIKKVSSFSECYKVLKGSFTGIDRKVIMPNLWD